jgi:AcrR family transcriptional regulator
MSGTVSRAGSLPRPAFDQRLVASMVAVLGVPPLPTAPVPQRSRREPTATWSLAPTRREQILTAALRLFRERGFHGVTMDEIGDAAGITGPTIYFHYKSKSDVLADAHERASVRTAVAVQDAVRAATSASDALDRLARAQLTVAADHGDLILVTSREIAPLERADRDRFVQRGREIVDVWVAVLGELRPELAPPELRAVALGVFPLMNQVASTRSDPADGVALVRAWALGDAHR